MIEFRNGYSTEGLPWSIYLKQKKNQVYKLLPLREEGGDWNSQLSSIEKDLGGLRFMIAQEEAILIQVLGKLGILYTEEDFLIYRKTIFEILTLLGEWEED